MVIRYNGCLLNVHLKCFMTVSIPGHGTKGSDERMAKASTDFDIALHPKAISAARTAGQSAHWLDQVTEEIQAGAAGERGS